MENTDTAFLYRGEISAQTMSDEYRKNKSVFDRCDVVWTWLACLTRLSFAVYPGYAPPLGLHAITTGPRRGMAPPGAEFPCPQCGKMYRWKQSLMLHLRVECGKEPQFQCPHCPHRAKHKAHLKRHIVCRHT